eukprot:NODE_3999_length_720_cov_311.780451.p1 GENE.NODE_3999_length_720_cov_311.780451~~NODE_3999_length_720_cov_311.780451.p1  ORF type:complete len:191 (+),score=67.42 NODE_3999_length_720_cov_311.780451:3-575(+)
MGKSVSKGATVATVLLELGSVLGERLSLGRYQRVAAPEGGVVGSYVHRTETDTHQSVGRIAALVAVHGDADARQLDAVATQLARHCAAAQPRFLTVEGVPDAVREKEMDTLRAAFLNQRGARAPPANIVDRVVQGQVKKFHKKVVLVHQEYIGPMQGTANPPDVAKWLRDQAAAAGATEIKVADFGVLAR